MWLMLLISLILQWKLKGPKNLHCVPLVHLADAAVEAQKFQNYSSIAINHHRLKLTPCLTLTPSTEFSSAQPQHITRYALLCLGLLLILIPALIHVMTIKSGSKNGNRIDSSGEITLWTKASCLTMWSNVIISQEFVRCSAKISLQHWIEYVFAAEARELCAKCQTRLTFMCRILPLKKQDHLRMNVALVIKQSS